MLSARLVFLTLTFILSTMLTRIRAAVPVTDPDPESVNPAPTPILHLNHAPAVSDAYVRLVILDLPQSDPLVLLWHI
jgi:hypothetical protein